MKREIDVVLEIEEHRHTKDTLSSALDMQYS